MTSTIAPHRNGYNGSVATPDDRPGRTERRGRAGAEAGGNANAADAIGGAPTEGPRALVSAAPLSSRNGGLPVDWEALARACVHPLRISILEILALDGGRVLSPTEMRLELQVPLSNTNYHVTELLGAGLIELVDTRAVRGATEHFYRLADARPSA